MQISGLDRTASAAVNANTHYATDRGYALRLQQSHEVIICYGNGDGSFSAGLAVNWTENPESLVPWDFNNDGTM
jgi:hypothetical protein